MSAPKNNEYESDSRKNAEGYLSQRLHSAVVLTNEKIFSSIKFSTFKKTYKAIYEINPEELKRIYDQWISQMRNSVQEDLKELCNEYSIDPLLNSLEKVNSSHFSHNSWRPSGNPDEDLRDHIYPLKVKHKENLEKVLDKLLVSNEELFNISTINHAEIMHIKKVNEDYHEKFSNIITSLCGSNLQNLIKNRENIIAEF